MDDTEAIAELETQLARHPAERYPVQHATDQFHLGVALTNAGRLNEAEAALATSARLFSDKLRAEYAKAVNARGAALRLAGRFEESAQAFTDAAAGFEAAELPLEQGAALFNLGLVRRELDDHAGAKACFEQSREYLDWETAPTYAAATARELGATLLAAGELDAARPQLEEAVDLADRAGDTPGLGAATNALGLTLLAQDQPDEAIEAFRRTVAAHPRTVRMPDFAMAQANLALAYERAGEQARARLAAAQAVGAPSAAEPVRAQAAQTLERLGDEPGAILEVVDLESPERWSLILREELNRWVDAAPETRQAEARAWIEGHLERRKVGSDLAEAWLGVLLELPPDDMNSVIRATLRALEGVEQERAERFRSLVSRTMVRFHIPQWSRLEDSFNRIAGELGQEAAWK